MGEGELLPVGRALTAALAVFAASAASPRPAPAQGLAYREHWGYLHLEARRAEVREELAGRDAATADRIAAMLCQPDRGVPFAPVAEALAALRGVAADPAFLLRSAIGAYVLPEVVDPQASNEACRALNVTLFLPFAVPLPGAVTFDLEVRNAAAELLWAAPVTWHTGERDLRTARPGATVPGGELPDGAYRLVVRTRIDGEGPRPHDPVCAWTFHVLRGYQQRAEQAMQQARAAASTLREPDDALLAGAAAQVGRAYTGEPFAVASDAVRDLQRLEGVLANTAGGRPAAQGLAGDLPFLLPVAGGPPLRCVLRRADGTAPRPLVVFVAGTPAYDTATNRPSAPATRDPAWLAHELREFGRRERWHVACLESPGIGRDFAVALREALPLLGRLCACGDRRPLLVAEREAAAIVGLRIADFRALVGGVVLVGGGAMAGPALQANGTLPVRLAALRGVGEQSLQRVIDYVALQQGSPTWRGDVAWLSTSRPPWPFALPLLADDIAAMARSLFPD